MNMGARARGTVLASKGLRVVYYDITPQYSSLVHGLRAMLIVIQGSWFNLHISMKTLQKRR
jgi:hypothetical protein